MEFNFQLKTLNNENIRIKCNDIFFNYVEMRKYCSEQDCLQMIEIIKRESGKKMAISFGNCQADRTMNFLINNRVFAKEYFFLTLPAVFEYQEHQVPMHQEQFWSLCDLLISQRVNNDNKFNAMLATQKLPQWLPEKSKIIWVPNIYFDGYFPQYAHNERNFEFDKDGRVPFLHADIYVDTFVSGGGTTEADLKKYIEEQDFISPTEVLAKVEKSFAELKKRQWPCDIHILDFIIDNYKRRQMFYCPNHPTQNVILELVHRILRFMDISDMSFEHMEVLMHPQNSLKGQDIPIYPKVAEIIGLEEYEKDDIFANWYMWPFKGNYVEYLLEYARHSWKDELAK